MPAKREPEQQQGEMFQVELQQLVDSGRALVWLEQSSAGSCLEAVLGAAYHATHGAPAISTRLMVA